MKPCVGLLVRACVRWRGGGCITEAKLTGEWWPVVEEAAEGVVALEGGARRRYAH